MNAQGNKLEYWSFKEWLIKFQNLCELKLPLKNIMLYNFWVKVDMKYNCRHWPVRQLVQVQTDWSKRGVKCYPTKLSDPSLSRPWSGGHASSKQGYRAMHAWQAGGCVSFPAMFATREGCVPTQGAQNKNFPSHWKCQHLKIGFYFIFRMRKISHEIGINTLTFDHLHRFSELVILFILEY